jgi:hypothetical protein
MSLKDLMTRMYKKCKVEELKKFNSLKFDLDKVKLPKEENRNR